MVPDAFQGPRWAATGVEEREPESKTAEGFRERGRDQVQNEQWTAHSEVLREEEHSRIVRIAQTNTNQSKTIPLICGAAAASLSW